MTPKRFTFRINLSKCSNWWGLNLVAAATIIWWILSITWGLAFSQKLQILVNSSSLSFGPKNSTNCFIRSVYWTWSKLPKIDEKILVFYLLHYIVCICGRYYYIVPGINELSHTHTHTSLSIKTSDEIISFMFIYMATISYGCLFLVKLVNLCYLCCSNWNSKFPLTTSSSNYTFMRQNHNLCVFNYINSLLHPCNTNISIFFNSFYC